VTNEAESGSSLAVVQSIHSGGSSYTPQTENVVVNQTDFSRIEDKFFIKASLSSQLIEVIQEHMEPSYPIPGTHYTLIESMYFDSSELSVFKDHFTADNRFKLRTRRYGPNGIWQNDFILLERKSKEECVTKKFRFQIGNLDYHRLFSGKTIIPSEELIDKNPELSSKKLLKRVEKVNQDIIRYELRPQCAVTYQRLCFEGSGLRLTIDNRLRANHKHEVDEKTANQIIESPSWSKIQAMRERYLQEQYLILEVKHSGSIPKWVLDFLQSTGSPKVSFSKYCFSISEALLKQRK